MSKWKWESYFFGVARWAVGLHAKGLEEMALGRSRAALAFANKNQLMSAVFLSSQLSVADGLVSKEPFVIRIS